MTFTNFKSSEIHCKIIYVGARNAGKTQNFISLLKSLDQEHRIPIIPYHATELGKGQKPLFEHLPIELGEQLGYKITANLYAFSPYIWSQEIVKDIALKGIDGFVFVADSDPSALVANIEALRDFRAILTQAGVNPHEIPQVIQYNKRDLASVLPLDMMRSVLGSASFPDQEAAALQDIGTMESLRSVSRQIIDKLLATL